MSEPTRKSADSVLASFLPKAGHSYAAYRNFDNGPGLHNEVSRLSPWVRTRMMPEWEIIGAVLKKHDPSDANKFIDEVCWRTYWKGWLQLRPSVWDDYLKELNENLTEWGADERYLSTINGHSGINCFDAWTRELTKTNYLHNHARMWYASIWIHTLKLPWALGAAFFLTHLLDGDPASNTLSWRWVAGLHTVGKTYLARIDNIRKYTKNRFKIDESLATKPIDLTVEPLPKPRTLTKLEPPPTHTKIGLLIQEDDLSAKNWISEMFGIQHSAGIFLKETYEQQRISEKVVQFRIESLRSTLNSGSELFESIEAAVAWAVSEGLDAIIMAEVPVGLWNEPIQQLKVAFNHAGIDLYFARHWWDELLQPNAKAGFFRFKKTIPKALRKLGSDT